MPSPADALPRFTLPPLAARRFQLQALGLAQPFPNIAAALDHLGYVQIDPLNICGRMHDLILRNRIAGYREGDLMRHVHGGDDSAEEAGVAASPTPLQAGPPLAAEERIAFEHHHPETHILVAFPLAAWPHLLAAMRQRSRRTSAWSGRLTPTERKLAPALLAEIAARGPLGSEDFDDDRRAHRVVWGAASLVKSTLQKLFFHGQLLIAQRTKHRRRYDLPERVLPARILALPEPPASDTRRWLATLKLQQRRLATLTRDELPVVHDRVVRIVVEDCPPLYCLTEDVPLLERIRGAEPASATGRPATAPSPSSAADGAMDRPADGAVASPEGQPHDAAAPVRLLAPLDPLIYDRRVTAALWNFDYRWEAYTPAAKRVRGHYALPVLAGTELVGHVEPRADRARGRLIVASRSVRRGYATAAAVRQLAKWLGLRYG